jgi:hypothetical protein
VNPPDPKTEPKTEPGRTLAAEASPKLPTWVVLLVVRPLRAGLLATAAGAGATVVGQPVLVFENWRRTLTLFAAAFVMSWILNAIELLSSMDSTAPENRFRTWREIWKKEGGGPPPPPPPNDRSSV